MKTTLFASMLLLWGFSVLASSRSQLTLAITTQGPDYYADGEPVRLGETYLLVYVASGSSFGGILSDGTLADPINNRIATRAKAVTGSRCGFKAIQYPPELYPEGGRWQIVLLDTRDAAGEVGGLVASIAAAPVVAAASGESTALGEIRVKAATDGAPTLQAETLARAPADTPRPAIAAMQAQDGRVGLRVRNVTNKALYEVQSTENLAGGEWQPAAGGARAQLTAQNAIPGPDGVELPVEVDVPVGARVRFFRVIVPGSN